MNTLKVQIREGKNHNSKVDFSVTAGLTLLLIVLTTWSPTGYSQTHDLLEPAPAWCCPSSGPAPLGTESAGA